MLGTIGHEFRVGLCPRFAMPFAGANGIAQRLIAYVARIAAAMSDEVAVEVDVSFGYAPYPGKAARVDGMDQKNTQPVSGNLPGNAALQQAHLDRGAAESLRPMGSGHDNQDPVSLARSEPGRFRRDRKSVV